MATTDTSHSSHSHQPSGSVSALIVGAIGVVFGDIGTSPLYTLKEAFSPHYHLGADHDTVLGLLSMIFWSVMIVVSVKYVAIIMRADNDGEGGIIALMTLAKRAFKKNSKWTYITGLLGIFGASLFFGDSIITPAITVLSALEGLQIAAPQLSHFIVPMALAVLITIFMTQRFGTAKVGKIFGPIMIIWFLTLGVVGIYNIAHNPHVLSAMNPYWGLAFSAKHFGAAIFVLGAVVLSVTGGEALYADMGHFGAKPIQLSWYFLVLPCLVLNYMGQGSLLLRDPSAYINPFYKSVPEWGLIPMIILASMASVIACQAVITGAFSVARQAMQLGYMPRMTIRHTSSDTIGQIYIPGINWILMIAVILLVLIFRSSAGLASAYGVSVSGTMLIDTLLLIVVARSQWGKLKYIILPLCALFLVVDISFLIANGYKFLDGAWVPVVIALTAFTMLRTWRRGRELLSQEIQKEGIQLDVFLPGLMLSPPVRVPGTAIFMIAQKNVVPHALLHNLKHNKVLHERNVFLTVETLTVPFLDNQSRVQVTEIADDFHRVIVKFGFMETPDVPQALMRISDSSDICIDPMETTYFASRETIEASRNRGMSFWRDKLFAVMHRNAAPATNFFRIPGNRLVELGSTVQI